MDNIQLILYIVFVVGYLIFKALTGKKKEQPDTESHHDQQGTPQKPRPATSFEDILRELTGVDTGQPLPETIDKPRQKAKEKADEVSERVREGYQKATAEAAKVEKLDERIDLKAPTEKIAVEEIDEEVIAEDNYLAWIKNADDAKKAFVLSEIINRKY